MEEEFGACLDRCPGIELKGIRALSEREFTIEDQRAKRRLRAEKLPLARKLIGTAQSETATDHDDHSVDGQSGERDHEARAEATRCPRCNQQRLIIVGEIPRARASQRHLLFADTS